MKINISYFFSNLSMMNIIYFVVEMINQFDHIRGLSSLLFVLSFYQSISVSSLFFWKLSNFCLIFASYFYNSSNNHSSLLFLDYLAILCVCSSYINSFQMNQLIYYFSLLEFNNYQTIETTKNITYILTMIKSVYRTRLFYSPIYSIVLLTNYLLAIVTYAIRRFLYYDIPKLNQNQNRITNMNTSYYHYIILTWILHLNTMSIIWICSLTAF